MVDSIKGWTAFAGAKAEDAKRIAYFVKRGGISPKNFIKGAVTPKALSELSQGMTVALGEVVKTQLVNYNK
jgi:predicted transcriptional regulator